MTIKLSRLFVALLACFVLPTISQATPQEFNGHWYEVIPYPTSGSPDKTWDTAKAAAEMTSFMGVDGHLATITSAGEDMFVNTIRGAAGLSRPEAWIGGMTPGGCTGCGWTWINGEGAISTMQVPLSSYSNWQGGEPNNLGAGEKHLGIGHTDAPGWNDEGNLGNIGGYVIEYDVPIPASECVSGEEGCPIAEGSTITFPDAVELTSMAMIDTRRYEFTDDPALCGTTERVLFGPATDPSNMIPDAILPAYLCGSPKFLVIVAETEGINVPSGTILVDNETSDVFPGNLYDCTGPNNPNAGDPLLDPDDPQNRDVMAWQTTDYTKMPENDVGASEGFPGSVGEFTFECGSSRGKGNKGSLYFVGLHIDFGPMYNDYSANPGGVQTQFELLTRYKLLVLKDVILESKVALNSNWVQRAGFRTLKRLINVAIRKHDRGQYNAARFRLQLIEALIQVLPYTVIPDENYQGETEMRTSNGIFMYTDKVIQ